MNDICLADIWVLMCFALCWFRLSCKLIRCSKARSASSPFSIIFHEAWHDALWSKYSIRADRQGAPEGRCFCPTDLSRVRKLLRAWNKWWCYFQPFAGYAWEPRMEAGPEAEHQVRTLESHACAEPSRPTVWEMLLHHVWSLKLFWSESPVKDKLSQMS